jgi:DNA-directed RNA polymerase specialized sigma24 family protein
MPSLASCLKRSQDGPSRQDSGVQPATANQQAANLFWLAFLLTGDRDASVDAAVEALDSSDGNAFFSAWMLAWSRKVVIAKALAAIRHDLAASAARMASTRGRNYPAPPRNWALAPGATKVQLERALLAIDTLPRCVLLLSLFEGLSIDDATVLLDIDRELVRKSQAFALQELTRNLARMPEAQRA